MKAIILNSEEWEDQYRNKQLGLVCFRDIEGVTQGMAFTCPECGQEGWIPFTIEGVVSNHKWDWNASKEKPTLKPSLLSTGCCGWHGYLTDGVFNKC